MAKNNKAITLGIIGGGQLGRMLAEASLKFPEHISGVVVLDPTEGCPASQAGATQIVGDFHDKNAIVELCLSADLITYEIESGDSRVLESLNYDVRIEPPPKTLRTIQDKYFQKKFLYENSIPVPEFDIVQSIDDLKEKAKPSRFGIPVMLKARRGGYDGRGNFRITDYSKIEEAWKYFDKRETMVEEMVDFGKEISVIAARNTKGEIATYPPVENLHEESILKMTIAPARIDESIAKKAKEIAYNTMGVIEGAGVFGIEMFVTRQKDVMINEIAPRVHNSGHHTLQSSKTSQFEQHLRAILGMELGDTSLNHYAVMYNILGPKEFEGEYKEITLGKSEKGNKEGSNEKASENDYYNYDGVYLKMYGKTMARPRRKLGHINVIDIEGNKDIEFLVKKAQEIGQCIKFEKPA